jgi:hypothetical protein
MSPLAKHKDSSHDLKNLTVQYRENEHPELANNQVYAVLCLSGFYFRQDMIFLLREWQSELTLGFEKSQKHVLKAFRCAQEPEPVI